MKNFKHRSREIRPTKFASESPHQPSIKKEIKIQSKNMQRQIEGRERNRFQLLNENIGENWCVNCGFGRFGHIRKENL